MFSRLISFFPIFNRVMKNYKKLPIDPTPTPPMLTRTTVICPLTRERGRVRRGWWVRGGMGVRWGGVRCGLGGTLGGGGVYDGGIRWGGGGGVDVRSWSKMLFFGLFWKIGRPWMNAFDRVLQKIAKI